MSIQLAEVTQADACLVESMLNDYLSELSMHREVPVGAIDAASYPYLNAYRTERGRHAFIIRSDGDAVGFAFIRGPDSTGSREHQLAEFYVKPESRRLAIGRRAAVAIWQRFPGPWELQVHAQNSAAVLFWHACTEAAASEAPQVHDLQAPDGRRIQFNFQVERAA